MGAFVASSTVSLNEKQTKLNQKHIQHEGNTTEPTPVSSAMRR